MLTNDELQELGDFITDRLPIRQIEFLATRKKRRILIVLNSFGEKEHFEKYYEMFAPTKPEKVDDKYLLLNPIASDVMETIELYFEDKKHKWSFGLTENALSEVVAMAQEKGHL